MFNLYGSGWRSADLSQWVRLNSAISRTGHLVPLSLENVRNAFAQYKFKSPNAGCSWIPAAPNGDDGLNIQAEHKTHWSRDPPVQMLMHKLFKRQDSAGNSMWGNSCCISQIHM